MIVHPSNATICERLNGMPCSTMRRHLARLVDAGLILRNDSPNGKRYVRRRPWGEQRFGFDLSPLSSRAVEIRAAARQARDTALMIADLRCDISLMRRDLLGFLDLADSQAVTLPCHEQYRDAADMAARILRRRLGAAELTQLRSQLAAALEQLRNELACVETVDMSTCGHQNEQHHQISRKEYSDSDGSEEDSPCRTHTKPCADLALTDIASNCTELVQLSTHPILDWPDLVRAAETVRPMMGIEASAWMRAKQTMGAIAASATLAAILQGFSRIRSPGAYLQALSSKAATGQFSVAQTVRTLTRDRPEFTAVNC